MSEQPPILSTPPIQIVLQRMHELESALTGCGFEVKIGRWYFDVSNPAAEPDDPADPLAVAFASARLKQRVHLAYREGALGWYWEWSGPTRDAIGEFEYVAPASAVAEVTMRASRILALVSDR